MADAPAIAASLLPKAAAKIPTVRSTSLAVPTQPHPKLARRRNYLRRKLITTLPKPTPETLTSTQMLAAEREGFEPEALPVQKVRDSEIPAAAILGFDAVEESHFVEASSIAEASASASPSDLGIISARNAVRFGAYFVGIFLLQAVVRALAVGSADSTEGKPTRRRSKRDEKLETNGNGNPLREGLDMTNGALLYVNEAELEEKIAEIRMMALEAKKREKKSSENADTSSDDEEEESGDDDDEVEDDTPRAKTGIEREIDGRLTRMRTGLNTVMENSQVMNVNFLNKSKHENAEKGKNNPLNRSEKDEDMLMFEKKYKFLNGDSSQPRDKPKGFQGSNQIGKKRNVGGKGNGISKKDIRVDTLLEAEALKIPDVNDVKEPTEAQIHFQSLKKDMGEESFKLGLKQEIEEDLEQYKGNVQDSTVEQIGDKVTQLRMSENLDSQIIVDGSGEMKTSRKHVVPQSNGRSKEARSIEIKPSTSRGDAKKFDATSDLWWLKLPYVLAIAMQQGYEEVEERGFYSLKTKSDSSSGTEASDSHTVLFQDRSDAQNFSLLLESYFEELEDIRITVVPLPIKELNEAVRSHTKKVIVVRKGQLRLYAGQPLDEVETALRSLLT